MTSKILAELSDKPRDDIEADLTRIRAQRERLEIEEQVLTAMLRLRDLENPVKRRLPGMDGPDMITGADDGRADRVGKSKASIPDLILTELGRNYEPWSIPRVIEAIQAAKPTAKPEAIRIALRRLHDRGTLLRDQDGNYRTMPDGARIAIGEP